MTRSIWNRFFSNHDRQAELHGTPAVLFDPSRMNKDKLSNGVPMGDIAAHAQGRLAQSYGALELIEGARNLGRIPEGASFSVVKARVQDKQGVPEFPAAHRMVGDLVLKQDGQPDKRLAELYHKPENARWIERNINAPTDIMHRLANVADRWMESGGMIQTLDRAANAVARGEMTAKEAFNNIVEPGYAKAVDTAIEKLDRNMAMLERKPLAQAVGRAIGNDLKAKGALQLQSKDLTTKTAVREMMVEVMRGYQEHSRLSAAQASDMLHKTRHMAIDKRIHQSLAQKPTVPAQSLNVTAGRRI